MATATTITIKDRETAKVVEAIRLRRGMTTGAGTARALILEHPEAQAIRSPFNKKKRK